MSLIVGAAYDVANAALPLSVPAMAYSNEVSMREQQEDVFVWIGICLVFIQWTKNVLAQALQLAFHQNDLITLESLEAAEEDTRRKTLGQLITRLRKRAEIAPDLEKLLDAFLSRRNSFVHGFVHRPEFNLCTEHGRSNVVEFTKELANDAFSITKILLGALFDSFNHYSRETNGYVRVPWEEVPTNISEALQYMIFESRSVVCRKESL